MGMSGEDRDDRPVALVLGAAVWRSGRASPTLERRAMRAVQLWRDGEVRAIVGCGGLGAHPPSEGQAIREICIREGVPDAVVLCEELSANTEENVRFALPLLREIDAREVIVVSDRYHLPRALLVARRLGVLARGAWPDAPFNRRRLRAVMREVPAYLWYALRLRR